MPEQKPLILIVEDNETIAELNARLLRRQGYETSVANTAAEALVLFKNNSFDLLVLDIMLPDGDGHSLCEEFRRKTDAPILFLTGKKEKEDKIKGFNSGGDYYLTKPYDRDEFLAVIGSLLRRVEMTREKITEVSVIVKASLTLKLDERKAYINGNDIQLTQKEFAVLLLLVQNESKELTNEQIYESVWGSKMNNDPHPIRLHISRLKKKLDEENSDDFSIFTEYGKGYTFIAYR